MPAKRSVNPQINGEDITGKVFGGWRVVRRASHRKKIVVQCLSCGKEDERWQSTLYSKNVYGCISCRNKAVTATGPANGYWKGTGSGKIPGSVMCKIRANAANRARTLECTVSLEYLEHLMNTQQWKCPYSGRELRFGSGPNNSGGNASLDRIDSKDGYVEGNVMWVDVNVNRAKWEMSPDAFVQLCTDVYKTQQAPIEPISKEEYDRRVAASRLIVSINGAADFSGDSDCVSGSCPVR